MGQSHLYLRTTQYLPDLALRWFLSRERLLIIVAAQTWAAPACFAAIATTPEPDPMSATRLFLTTLGFSVSHCASAKPLPQQNAQ